MSINSNKEFKISFYSGYIGGIANILSGQPFDICKVRIQTTGQGNLLSHFL